MSLPPSRPIRASGAALLIFILFLGSSPRSSSAAVRLALVVPPSARSPRHPPTLRRALADWATSDSAASPSSVVSVRPSTVGGGGGLFLSSASRPIPPGGTVATVPDCRIITCEDAVGDAHYGAEFAALAAAGGAGGRKAALAGFLAKEWLWWDYRRRNKTGGGGALGGGAWDEYFDVLPGWEEGDRAEHLLWWDRADVDRLLGGSVGYDEAVLLLEGTEVAMSILCDILAPADRGVSAALPPDVSPADVDAAVRASFVAVYTRSFRDDARDCVKFIPVLDMSQHADLKQGGANIEHYTDGETGDCVIVNAGGSALDPGEELFTCYAVEGEEMDPHEFFTIYGFVPGVKGNNGRTVRQMLEDEDEMLEDIFFDVEE